MAGLPPSSYGADSSAVRSLSAHSLFRRACPSRSCATALRLDPADLQHYGCTQANASGKTVPGAWAVFPAPPRAEALRFVSRACSFRRGSWKSKAMCAYPLLPPAVSNCLPPREPSQHSP